jgi:outer membrane protein
MSHRRPVAALVLLAAGLSAAEAAPAASPEQQAAAAAVAAEAAAAQTPADAGLDQATAIRLALARNETPEIAAARVAAAEAAMARANAALRPAVTVGGSLSTNDSDRLPRGGSANETKAWSAGAEMAILRASAWSGLAAARYALRAEQLDGLELRRALAFAVVEVYLGAVAADAQVIAAERRLEVSKSAVNDAKLRLEAGLTTRTDVTRADLERASAELSLTRARNLAETTRLALSDLIVAPVETLAAPAAIEVPQRDGKALSIMAVAYRADLRALQFREMAADQQVRAAYGRWIPDISARAEVSEYWTTDPRTKAGEDSLDVTLSLRAAWTLYDGGEREGAIAAAQAGRREVGFNRTRELRGLRRDLLTALADLGTAESALQQAEARDRLAKANAEEVRARYKQGLATALEDADAISSQFEAESGLVGARLDLDRARLGLRQLVGMWPLSDREPAAQP